MEKIELILDNKVVEVPSQMTLGMYQEIMKTPEKFEKDSIELISLFTNINIEDIKNLKYEEIEVLDFLIAQKINVPKKQELTLCFKHNDIEYGLENDWSKLAWGAWMDFEVYSADNIYKNLHKIMAILYRPIIKKGKFNVKKYTIEPYKSQSIEDRAEIMKDVPISYWFGASQFFFSIVLIYIKDTRDSLELQNKMTRITMKGWKILPKFLKKKLPLDSISTSPTNSQKRILQNLKKYKK